MSPSWILLDHDQAPAVDAMAVIRALADPLRWRIVELLAAQQLHVSRLAEELGAAQPLVSHHLKVLRQAGVIGSERYRYWTYYRLRPGALAVVGIRLGDLAGQTPSTLASRCAVPGESTSHPTRASSAQGDSAIGARQLDPISRQTFAASVAQLAEEFRGVFSVETIERYVEESIERLSGVRVTDFIPLFVHRFVLERLQALAQTEGAIAKAVPEVLFVCVHNAGRSQMAAALLDHHAKGQVHVRSAGSDPADQLSPAVVAAMAEWGIHLSREFPKPLTDEVVRAADVVVTMGCGDACPLYPGKRYLDWELGDTIGRPVEQVRAIRDDLDHRVRALLGKLVPTDAP